MFLYTCANTSALRRLSFAVTLLIVLFAPAMWGQSSVTRLDADTAGVHGTAVAVDRHVAGRQPRFDWDHDGRAARPSRARPCSRTT